MAEGTGLRAKGLREITFPHASGPRDNHRLSGGDPETIRKAHEDSPLESPRYGEVDFGKGCAGPEAGSLGEPARPAVVAIVPLGVGDVRNKFVGRERAILRRLEDRPECSLHAVELEKMQLLEGGGVVHRYLLNGAY